MKKKDDYGPFYEMTKCGSTWKFEQDQIQIWTHTINHISCNEWHNDESINHISGPMNDLDRNIQKSSLATPWKQWNETWSEWWPRDHEDNEAEIWIKAHLGSSLYFHKLELARSKFETKYRPRIFNQENDQHKLCTNAMDHN